MPVGVVGTAAAATVRGSDPVVALPEREDVPGDAVGETVHEIENRIRRLGATFDRERSKQQDFFAWGYSHFFDEGLARDPVIVFF